jgi:hypothetical protein
MCLVAQDRIQTGVNLRKRIWKGNSKYCLCGCETAHHIFFNCHKSRLVWFYFKEALGWDKVPISLQEVFEHWLPLGVHNYDIKLFMLAIILQGSLECKKQNGDRKTLSTFF